MRKLQSVFTTCFLLANTCIFAQETLDITSVSSWPMLHNSVTAWEDGAFNVSVDPSNQNDLGWGIYNPSNHNVYGDSIYVLQDPNGDFKQLYIEHLVNGQFKFHYADIDGDNSNTVIIDKDDFQGKNFGHYSLYFQNEGHDLEPLSADWDFMFTRYNRAGDHYGVAGILTNKHIKVAEVNTSDLSSVDATSLNYSEEINTIGYDWKQFGSTGFEVVSNRAYFVIDELDNDTTTVVFESFSGSSGGGITQMLVNGVSQTVEMGVGYVNRVFFDLDEGVVHSSARNAWDLAFDGDNFGTVIRSNEELGYKLWVYPDGDASLWNENVSVEHHENINFISLHSNPIKQEMHLDISVETEENIQIELFSITGQTVLSNKQISVSGLQTFSFNVGHLKGGFYELVISSSDGLILKSEKVIKF